MFKNSKNGSLGEQKIVKILQGAYVKYEREKVFGDLRQGTYRFDFFLPDLKIVIEYNGIQHYEYTKVFHSKKEDFLKAQERDRRKISYCLAHKYKLYCIPYWEIENLKTLKDLFQSKFLAKTKFHNDIVWKQQKF